VNGVPREAHVRAKLQPIASPMRQKFPALRKRRFELVW
jgi:hypothetical protein